MNTSSLNQANKQFWDAAREQVKQGNCNFKDIHFPPEPYPIDGFNGLVFSEQASFDNAVFEDNIYFRGAIFKTYASFNNAKFNGTSEFTGVVFNNHASFLGAEFKEHAHFRESQFIARAIFDCAKIKDGYFHDSKFYGIASFIDVNFGTANFLGVIFEKDAWFQRARFGKEALFSSAIFMKSATFEDSIFEGKVDFSNARALESVVFSLPSSRKGRSSFIHPEHGVSAYRLAKQSAINSGDSISAADYQFAELCAVEKGKLARWNKQEFKDLTKLERAKQVINGIFRLIVMRWLFGYGVRPLRIVVSSLLVILLFALIYWGSNEVCVNTICELPFFQALFISSSTFTTLGYYGNYQLMGYTRFLVGCEAFLGTLFMSAFLVVLGKRYM